MHLISTLATALFAGAASTSNCPPFSSTIIPFSSNFHEPSPPLVKPEFQCNFIQHKWNQNISHITTGYIQNSPSRGIVRADEAFDGNLASSVFNYANTTKDGLVDNTLTTYSGNSTRPEVWRGYVNSGFPIFSAELLVKSGAVYAGLVKRQFVEAEVAAWNIMYQGAIPVTVFVDGCGVAVGYDFFAPELRTRVITEFFNIKARDTR